MYTAYKFVDGGSQFITKIGLSAHIGNIDELTPKYKNVIAFDYFTTKEGMSIRQKIERVTKKNLLMCPNIMADQVIKYPNYIYVKGKIGDSDIIVDADTITIDGQIVESSTDIDDTLLATPVAEAQVDTAETVEPAEPEKQEAPIDAVLNEVAPEAPVAEPVEEVHQEPNPVEVEAQQEEQTDEPEAENTELFFTGEDATEEVSEDKEAADTEALVAALPDPELLEELSVPEPVKQSASEPEPVEEKKDSFESFMNPPNKPDLYSAPMGFGFSKERNKKESEFVIGTTSFDESFSTSNTLPKSNAQKLRERTSNKRPVTAPESVVAPVQKSVKEEPVKEVKEVAKPAPVKWEQTKAEIFKDTDIRPLEVPEEKTAAPDNTARKEFLDKLDQEIKDAIVYIPRAALGNIQEYVVRPIDTERLKEEGNGYCINGMWHKSADWFCIDVINESARFFYNSKMEIAIQIPINICHQWYKLTE